MSIGLFYSRVLLIRIPKELNTLLSFFVFIAALMSTIFLLILLKTLLNPKKPFFSFLNENLKIPILTFIQTSYTVLYQKMFLPGLFTDQIYLFLYEKYKKFYKFCKKNDFFIILCFYFFPQVLLAITFFVEITFFSQIKCFYFMLPIYLISIIFNIVFLKALLDFASLNYLDIKNYIELTITSNGLAYKLRDKYQNNFQLNNEFEYICETALKMSHIITKMNRLKTLKESYEKKFKVFITILYLLSWLQIIIFYLGNFYYFCKFLNFN